MTKEGTKNKCVPCNQSECIYVTKFKPVQIPNEKDIAWAQFDNTNFMCPITNHIYFALSTIKRAVSIKTNFNGKLPQSHIPAPNTFQLRLILPSYCHKDLIHLIYTVASSVDLFQRTEESICRPTWIWLWTKSISNELDITLYLPTQLSRPINSLHNRVWRHRQK